jgi:hypothetical protein
MCRRPRHQAMPDCVRNSKDFLCPDFPTKYRYPHHHGPICSPHPQLRRVVLVGDGQWPLINGEQESLRQKRRANRASERRVCRMSEKRGQARNPLNACEIPTRSFSLLEELRGRINVKRSRRAKGGKGDVPAVFLHTRRLFPATAEWKGSEAAIRWRFAWIWLALKFCGDKSIMERTRRCRL